MGIGTQIALFLSGLCLGGSFVYWLDSREQLRRAKRYLRREQKKKREAGGKCVDGDQTRKDAISTQKAWERTRSDLRESYLRSSGNAVLPIYACSDFEKDSVNIIQRRTLEIWDEASQISERHYGKRNPEIDKMRDDFAALVLGAEEQRIEK